MKRIFAFLLALIMLTALVSSYALADDEHIVLKLGFTNNEDHPNYIASKQFADEVLEKTNGAVEIQLYPNSQLGGERDMAEGLELGTMEMALLGTGGLRVYNDKLQLFFLPFLFNSREAAYEVLDGPIGEEIYSCIDADVKILGSYENGFRHITNSKRPIVVPEDLEGIKIRTPEIPVMLDTFEGLGANPTAMAFGELFTAMQQKTVDGQENPLVTIVSSKFYEVQPYLSLTGHVWDPFAVTISNKAWDSLSEEQQQIVQEALDKAIDYQRELCQKADEECLDQLEQLGVEINETDPKVWREAVQPIYDKYAEEFGADLIAEIQAVE